MDGAKFGMVIMKEPQLGIVVSGSTLHLTIQSGKISVLFEMVQQERKANGVAKTERGKAKLGNIGRGNGLLAFAHRDI